MTVFLAGKILAKRRKGKVSAKYFEPVHNDGIKYSGLWFSAYDFRFKIGNEGTLQFEVEGHITSEARR